MERGLYLPIIYTRVVEEGKVKMLWVLGKFQHYRVRHAFREANRVADAMVKLVGVMQDHFVVWDIPPSNVIANFVYFDTNGENVCRLAASNLAILA